MQCLAVAYIWVQAEQDLAQGHEIRSELLQINLRALSVSSFCFSGYNCADPCRALVLLNLLGKPSSEDQWDPRELVLTILLRLLR